MSKELKTEKMDPKLRTAAGQVPAAVLAELPTWDIEGGRTQISVSECPLGSVSGPWSYAGEDQTVRCLVEDQGGETDQLCVELRGLGGLLTLAPCNQVSQLLCNVIY